MIHVSIPTAQELKRHISPERFYRDMLNGRIGKHTGNSWYEWIGLCPFHNDSRPGSFFINLRTGAFKCFSCGTGGGDILDFYMTYQGCLLPEALRDMGGFYAIYS